MAIDIDLKAEIDRMPLARRMRFFWLQLAMSAVVFLVISVWVAYDINSVETDPESTVRIWWPIAMLYEQFGYWSAVLAMPIIGLVTCGLWIFRLIKPGPESPAAQRSIKKASPRGFRDASS